MAEDEDGVSNRKSQQNSNEGDNSKDSEQNARKPDLGFEETKHNTNENGDSSSTEARCSSSKTSGAIRKEENPFSFRHFLKRDLSLPGNSTYENTGARPKVYANTVQHSPTRINVHSDSKRDRHRVVDSQAKESGSNGSCPRVSDNTSSSSSVEIPFSVVDNSDSKHNFYADNTESSFYHRPNLASEPLGMPSLPDFVQDHILVEQAYLNPNGPISVDLDNLPDFTFNTNFNVGSSPSGSRRSNNYSGGGRSYDYESYIGGASTSNEAGPSRQPGPLDLPVGAEAAPPDLSAHLSLDLTESVNPERRNMSPGSFPLDLPPNAGAESMRLPDFLPMHPGRTSPEPEHVDQQLQQIMSELERTRSELFAERNRRSRIEGELASTREQMLSLRSETASARASESALRQRLNEARMADKQYTGQLENVAQAVEHNLLDTASRATEAECTISRLQEQIKKLKEDLSLAHAQNASLRSSQAQAASQLRRATAVAQNSLTELLSGVDQLKVLSSNLDPT